MNARDRFPTRSDGFPDERVIDTSVYEAMCDRIDTLTAERDELQAKNAQLVAAYDQGQVERWAALRAVPTPEHIEVGIDWCLTHRGIRTGEPDYNFDDGSPRCDCWFEDSVDPARACEFVPLGYLSVPPQAPKSEPEVSPKEPSE